MGVAGYGRLVVLGLGRFFIRYWAACGYLAGVAAAEIVVDILPASQASALAQWASTNVTNLHHHPIPALILSAFFPAGSPLDWLVLIPLAMFSATRPLGNVRLAAVCAAANVIGSVVSEAILADRVDHGSLPASARNIIDIGPSYVVVAAIVIAVMFGSWLARIAAVLDFALLVFVAHIFAGLGQLEVAPVGHVTSMVVAAVLGTAFGWQRRRRRAGRAAQLKRQRPASRSARPARGHWPA